MGGESIEDKIAGTIPLVITTGVAMNVYERTLGSSGKKPKKKMVNKVFGAKKISFGNSKKNGLYDL